MVPWLTDGPAPLPAYLYSSTVTYTQATMAIVQCRGCGLSQQADRIEQMPWLQADEPFTKRCTLLAREAWSQIKNPRVAVSTYTDRSRAMVEAFAAEGTSDIKTGILADEVGERDVVSILDFDCLEYPGDALAMVAKILAPDGVAQLGFQYLPEVVGTSQYDALHPEKGSYWTLTALQLFLLKYGLEVLDAERCPEIDRGTGYMVVVAGRMQAYPHARGLYPWGWWEELVGWAGGAVWDTTNPYSAAQYRLHIIRNEVWRLLSTKPNWVSFGSSKLALRLGTLLGIGRHPNVTFHWDASVAAETTIHALFTPWGKQVFGPQAACWEMQDENTGILILDCRGESTLPETFTGGVVYPLPIPYFTVKK